ncbi:hypothetical protein AAG895_09225 [Thauera sp. JM12B12]|uniref:hypothetical protein n=1 Tax=Thauera sp. JM12B12 TaxID=3142262 RepID=UPI0031F3F924
MATTNTITDREFFTYPFVYAELAACARKHDPEMFVRMGQMLDMCPSQTLRGLSYAAFMLLDIDESERNPQWALAQQAIAELSSFVAALLEHQNDAACLEIATDERAARPV